MRQTLPADHSASKGICDMMRGLPLTGLTVLEHVAGECEVTSRAIALAGRIANDLGATVVQLRPATGPEAADGTIRDRFLDAGKKVEAGPPAYLANALLTNILRPLDPDLALIPVKVVVSHGAPPSLGLRESEVTDATILALSGLLDLVGHPEEAPVPLGGQQASGVAGLAAFSGMMAALATGQPETVQVSALEACLWSNWKSYAERLYLGRTPTRQGRLAEWQALACADGHATMIYLEKDWPAICRLIGDRRLSAPPLDTQAGRRANMAAVYEIMRPWYRSRTRVEIARLAKAEGLPIAPVLSVGEVIGDPQFAAQRFFSPPAGEAVEGAARVPTIPTAWNGERFPPRVSTGTETPLDDTRQRLRKATGASRAPLAGCRVLDLGIITAGASTSAILADLGADVIKVEASAYIDPFRTWDRGLGAADWWNRSRFFAFTNRNKRGLALDLKSAEGKALFLDLVAKADVVVENFRRGVLERLGLGWDVLHAHNPRLVLCSITSQGELGPDAGAATYGSTLEANSGLADLTRDERGEPLISGILLNYPDQIVSIYAAGIVATAIMEQRRSGAGVRLDISQRELASFLIGEPILAATSSTPLPAAPRPAFARRSDGAWMLISADGRTVPVRDAKGMLEAVERGETRIAFAKGPDGAWAKGMPFELGGLPFHVHRPAPNLGQHNSEVLREVLGLTDERIAELAAKGVIGTAPKG